MVKAADLAPKAHASQAGCRFISAMQLDEVQCSPWPLSDQAAVKGTGLPASTLQQPPCRQSPGALQVQWWDHIEMNCSLEPVPSPDWDQAFVESAGQHHLLMSSQLAAAS